MANKLIITGTDYASDGAISAVYLRVILPSSEAAAYPYTFSVTYGSDTLLSQSFAPATWAKLTPPTGGWTATAVKEMVISGMKYSLYRTVWADTQILVVGGPFSTGNSNFLAFF